MKIWKIEELLESAKAHGLEPVSVRDIQNGKQFTLHGGTKANWYSTGKVNVQGKDTAEKILLQNIINEGEVPLTVPLTPKGTVHEDLDKSITSGQRFDPKVFVVYGHDTAARDQLELLLLRMNIKPEILGNMTPDGKTIIEALIASCNVPYAVVLLTPDDTGCSVASPGELRPRARQNVVLEMGMVLAKLGRERVAILHKGELELPSDINGLIYIPFKASVQECKNKLAASLQKAGFYIDIATLQGE